MSLSHFSKDEYLIDGVQLLPAFFGTSRVRVRQAADADRSELHHGRVIFSYADVPFCGSTRGFIVVTEDGLDGGPGKKGRSRNGGGGGSVVFVERLSRYQVRVVRLQAQRRDSDSECTSDSEDEAADDTSAGWLVVGQAQAEVRRYLVERLTIESREGITWAQKDQLDAELDHLVKGLARIRDYSQSVSQTYTAFICLSFPRSSPLSIDANHTGSKSPPLLLTMLNSYLEVLQEELTLTKAGLRTEQDKASRLAVESDNGDGVLHNAAAHRERAAALYSINKRLAAAEGDFQTELERLREAHKSAAVGAAPTHVDAQAFATRSLSAVRVDVTGISLTPPSVTPTIRVDKASTAAKEKKDKKEKKEKAKKAKKAEDATAAPKAKVQATLLEVDDRPAPVQLSPRHHHSPVYAKDEAASTSKRAKPKVKRAK